MVSVGSSPPPPNQKIPTMWGFLFGTEEAHAWLPFGLEVKLSEAVERCSDAYPNSNLDPNKILILKSNPYYRKNMRA